MTGYGRAQVERDGRRLIVELKSVNHRFLDVAFRMPRSFAFMEEDIRKRLAASLARGHVDVLVRYDNSRDDGKSVMLDQALLSAYLDALFVIADRERDLDDDISVMRVAQLPGMLTITEAEENQEALLELMREALDQALALLVDMRAREGEALRADMLARIDALEALTGQVEARYPETVAKYREKLRARVEELIGMDMDESRLLTEVAIMADRSAVDEETVRLRSHFAQMRRTLGGGGESGRKLDFLVQELNREFNTISSKSQDITLTDIAVSAKAQIEKLREQVQNAE